jgi:hypothetical protein
VSASGVDKLSEVRPTNGRRWPKVIRLDPHHTGHVVLCIFKKERPWKDNIPETPESGVKGWCSVGQCWFPEGYSKPLLYASATLTICRHSVSYLCVVLCMRLCFMCPLFASSATTVIGVFRDRLQLDSGVGDVV